MKDIVLRKAKIVDANAIKKIVNTFAAKGRMLPISLNQIYERLRNFTVIEKNGKIIGCGALKIIWKDLGEIRSIAVSPAQQKKGYANILIDTLLEEALDLELKRVFVLTYVPELFQKKGFSVIPKSKLPHKVWVDCINCPKFPRCDETALIKHIPNK